MELLLTIQNVVRVWGLHQVRLVSHNVMCGASQQRRQTVAGVESREVVQLLLLDLGARRRDGLHSAHRRLGLHDGTVCGDWRTTSSVLWRVSVREDGRVHAGGRTH